MAQPDTLVSTDRKAALQAQYDVLNPAALRRDILRLQHHLGAPTRQTPSLGRARPCYDFQRPLILRQRFLVQVLLLLREDSAVFHFRTAQIIADVYACTSWHNRIKASC